MRFAAFFLFVAPLFGQATFTLSGIAGDGNLSVTVSADAVTNIQAYISGTAPSSAWPNGAGIPSDTKLNGAAGSNAASLTLQSAANVQPCNGLQVDSEIYVVLSVNGNTVSVQPGRVGTVTAAHSNGTAVHVLRFGNYTCFLKGLWADSIGAIEQSKLQGTALAAQTAAVAAANAQIASIVSQAVQ